MDMRAGPADRRLRRPASVAAMACAVTLLLASACGGVTSTDGAAVFPGSGYVSTAVTEDGRPRPLVAGSVLTLRFNAEGIGASAGCNALFATGGIRSGVLVVDALGSTEMACEPDLMDQESWWSQFLLGRPVVEVVDRGLTLTRGTTSVAMVADAAVPDVPLEATAWQLDTIVTGDAASSVPAGAASRLVVGSGQIEVSIEGCRQTSEAATVGPASITVAPGAFAAAGCDGPAAIVDRAVVAVFGAGEVRYLIEGDRLTVTGPFGAGLVYRGS